MHAEKSKRRLQGMTLLESLVVMVLLAVLIAMLAPAFAPAHINYQRIHCINNLKQISMAFQLWKDDNLNAYPMELSTNDGGSQEYSSGPEVFRHFQVMQNELAQAPRLLLCPADTERFVATNFINIDNSNISYFVGVTVSATNANPSLFLCGDRNLGGGTSVSNGLLSLTTNDLAGWMIGMHTNQQQTVGNILFSDGSVQMLSTPELRQALKKPGVAPAVLAVP